jgi:DnaK suppressor protein
MSATRKRSGLRSLSRARQFERLREELTSARSALLRGTLATCQPLPDQGLPADPLDLASNDRDEAFDQLLKNRASAKLRQIERALRRMAEASYGVCLGCGNDIPIERLKVQPETLYCVACKDRNELAASLRGRLVSV